MAAHQKVTGKPADFWASAVTYASLQVLEQSIEAVGLDRKAVTDHINKSTFQTVMGPWKFNKQSIDKFWTVGQWQGGVFHGVAIDRAARRQAGDRQVRLVAGRASGPDSTTPVPDSGTGVFYSCGDGHPDHRHCCWARPTR